MRSTTFRKTTADIDRMNIGETSVPDWHLIFKLDLQQSFIPVQRSYQDFHHLYKKYPLKSIVDFKRSNIIMPQAGPLVALDEKIIEDKISRVVKNLSLRRAITSFGGAGMLGVILDVVMYSLRFKVGDGLATFTSADYSLVRWEKISNDVFVCYGDVRIFTAMLGGHSLDADTELKGAYLIDGISEFKTKSHVEARKFTSTEHQESGFEPVLDKETGFELVLEPRRPLLDCQATWVMRKTQGNKFNIRLEQLEIKAFHKDLYYREQNPEMENLFNIPDEDFVPIEQSRASRFFDILNPRNELDWSVVNRSDINDALEEHNNKNFRQSKQVLRM